MTLNTRKNLAVQILPAGGDNPLKLRLQMNRTVKVGATVGLIIGALIGQGGTPGYAYSIASGSLPTNTSLNADGTIQVIGALTPGKTAFLAEVQDSATTIFQATFEIDIDSSLSVIHGNPTPMENGYAYSYTFQIYGATGTVSWSISSGSVSTGVSLGSSTGILSGTPTSTAPADFIFVVTASDSGTGESIDIPCSVHLYEKFNFTSLNVGVYTIQTGVPFPTTHVGYIHGAAPFSSIYVQTYDSGFSPVAFPTGLTIAYSTSDHTVTFLANDPFPERIFTFRTVDALGHSPVTPGTVHITAINPIPSTDSGNSITQGADGALYSAGATGATGPAGATGPTGATGAAGSGSGGSIAVYFP